MNEAPNTVEGWSIKLAEVGCEAPSFDAQKKYLRSWIESHNDSVLLQSIVHDLMRENAVLKERLSAREVV